MGKNHKITHQNRPNYQNPGMKTELGGLWDESKEQVKKDIRALFSFIFHKKSRRIQLSRREQVIFGNWFTSTDIYKKGIKLKKRAQTKKIEFRIKLTFFLNRLASLFRLIALRMTYFILGTICVTFIILLYQTAVFVKNLPNPKILITRDIPSTAKIYDRNKTLLYEIYQEENRTPVRLSQIPSFLKQATISIEDKDFYLHDGISPAGVLRAFVHNVSSDTKEGGSTITQQLIRSTFLTPQKTVARKIVEMFLAYWTEQLYSKDQILEMYLNQVPYGGTAWGVEAASQTYFGKSVKDLTLSESALLAGLPAAPTLYSPFGAHPEYAKQRQQEVLTRMVEDGYITKSTAEQAKQEKLVYQFPHISIAAPHFVMYVKDLLNTYYGERVTAQEGLRVFTTLDLTIQNTVQKIVSSHLSSLASLSVSNGAALVANPKTGEILAMVGSADYFNVDIDGAVNITTSLRPPGSTIKVVTYAAALQNGYTAQTILDDTPVTYSDGFTSYSPHNYDGKYHGKVPLRVALASSYNVPAVRVLAAIGVPKMVDQAKKMGITSWNDTSRFGLSLTLGAAETTMLDMTRVYATLANEGISTNLSPFLKIENLKGETLSPPVSQNRFFAVPKDVAKTLSEILSDNGARTPAFGPNSPLIIPGETVSVKTGTSDSKRDNWTIGYTPDFVVAVWVGNNDNTPMNPSLTSGITGAAPIWHDIMTELLKNKK